MLSKEEIKQSKENDLTVPDISELYCYETIVPDLNEIPDTKENSEDVVKELTALNKDIFYDIFACSDDEEIVSGTPTQIDMIIQPDKKLFQQTRGLPQHMPKVHTDDLRHRKRENLCYYREHLLNGFYSGFFSIIACLNCQAVADAFPSLTKRVYWFPRKMCKYCSGRIRPFTKRHMRIMSAAAKHFSKDKFMHSLLISKNLH